MEDIFKDLPRICFGKRKNIPSGVVEDYLILEEFTKGFNQTERNNFEKIVKCFSWTSKSNSGIILPPCYGIFPLKENLDVLIMRFLDDGYDNQGRPDLLRVDCVKLPVSYLENLKAKPEVFFSGLFWNMHFPKITSIEDLDSEESARIIKLFLEKLKTPLIIGDTSNYTFKFSDGNLRTFNTLTKKNDEVSIEIKNHVLKAPVVITPPIKVATTQPSTFPIFKFSVVLTVLVAIGVPGYLGPKYLVFKTELDKAKYELEDPKGKVKILEGNLKIEKDGNAPNVKKIDDLKKEMDKLKEKHFKERLTKADAKEVVQWKKDYTGQILGKAKGFYDEAAKKLNEFITGENKKW